jgi:hypothetical protein
MSLSDGQSVGSLLVVEEKNGRFNAASEDIFAISEQLEAISQDEYDRIYAVLSNAEPDAGLPVPIYRIAWPHILKEQRGGLQELVVLYTQLQAAVEQSNPDMLVCGDHVDRGYRAVLADIGDVHSIPVHNVDRPVSWTGAVRRFLVSTVLLGPFFLDQLLALALNPFTRNPAETTAAYVPALGRIGSIKPVLTESSFDFEVIVTSFLSSWLWIWRDDELAQFDPLPISAFTSLGCLLRQARLHFQIGNAVLFDDHLERDLRAELDDELGIKPSRTLEYAFQNSFRTRLLGSLLLYPLFDDFLTQVDTENLVSGKLSPGGRATLFAGLDHGCDVYHVPHGIGMTRCPNPPEPLTQCLSGELQRRHYRESLQVTTEWNMVVTGRAYLTELYRDHGDTSTGDEGETCRILLATQPFGERKAFVRRTVSAIDRSAPDAEVVIKTHPSEDPEFYASFTDEYPNVSVSAGDLFNHLKVADLTVTVYSNVGVESIIVGTPCICVNDWDPIIPIPAYARYGPIPVLTDLDSLVTFFDNIDDTFLSKLQADQREFIHNGFELEVNAAKNIVDIIDG